MNETTNSDHYLELTNENWLNELTLHSEFCLNGLKINDPENLIDESFKPTTYNNTEEDTRKIYRKGNKHYKVKNGFIIGFGLALNDLSREDFVIKFGEPLSEVVLIGNIYGLDFYDIEGFDLVYTNFRLVMDPYKEKLESIQFGEKLLSWDE